MSVSMRDLTDEQLRRFLSRVPARHLLAYLKTLPATDRERLLGLVSSTSAAFIRQALPDAAEGRVSEAQRILEEAAAQNESCTFCRIFEGELPGSYVYQDDQLAVIMDLYPVVPGHMLVIPRQHFTYIEDIPSEIAAAMVTRAQVLSRALMRSELGPDGVSLYQTNRGAGGQDVFHVHLHVIPRYHGDRFGFRFPPGYPREAERADLDAKAAMIGQAMEAYGR